MFIHPALPYKYQCDRNLAIECCALYLAQESTTRYQSIKSGTANCYLAAVVDIAIDLKQLDLLKNNHSIKAQCADNVLTEVKWW